MGAPLLDIDTGLRRDAVGDTAEILTEIFRDDTHLAVWQRSLPSELETECRDIIDADIPIGFRIQQNVSAASQTDSGITELGKYRHLQDDILLLADMFSCLFELETVGIRLSVLSSAMCPKFHVDRVPCRLVTTYLGKGSEWLPHACVDRSKLGAGGGGLNDEDSGLYQPRQAVRQIAAADVALLKGEMWEGNEGAGLVHRSPHLAAGEKRLLLTMDFA